jgi:SAM-dependent methyltransferase
MGIKNMESKQPEPIDWKVESQRFDTVPEAYDAFRPEYPEILVQTLITRAALPPRGNILEIGSGTGKATAPFARRGYTILCVEPGARLVALAAKKFIGYSRVAFANSTFEDWPGEEGSYDLVLSAQSFHWVDKTTGFPKIAQALKPGGWLAVYWNMQPEDTSPIWRDLDQVYRERMPSLKKNNQPIEEQIAERVKEIEVSGCFGPVDVHRFPWQKTYTVEQYLGLLGTYSDHLRQGTAASTAFYAGVAGVINRYGGMINKKYIAVLYMAQKA